MNYLTIDVEDYYQVSAFEAVIDPGSWETLESRVVRNTNVILEMLEERNIKATFFIVGWIADRHPSLVRRIHHLGHEVACHSYWHKKIFDLTPDAFKQDTLRAKQCLEDIISNNVHGYRAPSYSITDKSLWALDVLADMGFKYDSSIFPTYHDNYGIPEAPRFAFRLETQNMMEYPISTANIMKQNIPVSGGGYFRLFPYAITKAALKRINIREKQPFIFYFHPWEIDPEQPRIKQACRLSRFRHYVNLKTTRLKLEKLLNDFEFGPFSLNHG